MSRSSAETESPCGSAVTVVGVDRSDDEALICAHDSRKRRAEKTRPLVTVKAPLDGRLIVKSVSIFGKTVACAAEVPAFNSIRHTMVLFEKSTLIT